jgi:hypothetical protein
VSVEQLIGSASGSRSSCASVVAASFLNAADLVAVIATDGAEGRLAERVFRDLQQSPGTHVLRVAADGAPWSSAGAFPSGRAAPWFGGDLTLLAAEFAGHGEANADVRRSVLLWHGVDDYIAQHPARFEEVVAHVAAALARRWEGSWRPFQIDRAVLIGGPLLQGRLESLAAHARDEVRFRYLLVR